MSGSPGVSRLGRWSAWTVVVLSVLYVVTGVAGLLLGHLAGGDNFGQSDPYLAILEWLIVAVTIPIITMFAAACLQAPAAKKAHALSALSFAVLCCGLTAAIHFFRLAVVRRLDPGTTEALSALVSFRWPSVAFALDLLAWDLFLGIALILLSDVFADRSVRLTSAAAGSLCLLGFLGPATGDLRIQF